MNQYRFSDLVLDKQETFTRIVTSAMMEEFLSISGDSNPLHQDVVYAQEQGFRDRVVYGLLTASFYSTLVGVYLPGKYALLQGLKKISFSKPVFIGDELKVHGKVSYLNEAYRVMEMKAWIDNQKGETVSSAVISVGLLV